MISVCLKYTRKFLFILLLILAAPIPALAGAIVGGTFTIAGVVNISEVSPALTYNSTRGEYLTVWYNDLTSDDDIWAQRLDKNGAKIGGSFNISWKTGHDKRDPDVAYNSQHDQYLVVWENEQTYKSIRARRLSGTGALIDTTDIILIGDVDLFTPAKPAVAYSPTSDRYMVVWAETWHAIPNQFSIYAQMVKPDGTMDGGPFAVSSPNYTHYRGYPDIAYNHHANRHLVVWEQNSGGTTPTMDILGCQVKGDGETFGSEFTISDSSTDMVNAAVAAIPTSPGNIKFFVVFQLDNGPMNFDILGKFVEDDGTVVSGNVEIGRTNKNETDPDVAGSDDSQEYLVVWREDVGFKDSPIKARLYSSCGADLGIIFELDGPVIYEPVTTAGHMGDFLLAWQDLPISAVYWNLYGALFGRRNYLPLTSY